MTPDDNPNWGTRELRARHKTRFVPTESAGVDAVKIEDECLLDELMLGGWLRHLDEDEERAQRRLHAGLKLRELWDGAGLRPRETAAYATMGDGVTPSPDDVTDHQASLRAVCSRVLRKAGDQAWFLQELCVFDRLIPGYFASDVREALDLLAKIIG